MKRLGYMEKTYRHWGDGGEALLKFQSLASRVSINLKFPVVKNVAPSEIFCTGTTGDLP